MTGDTVGPRLPGGNVGPSGWAVGRVSSCRALALRPHTLPLPGSPRNVLAALPAQLRSRGCPGALPAPTQHLLALPSSCQLAHRPSLFAARHPDPGPRRLVLLSRAGRGHVACGDPLRKSPFPSQHGTMRGDLLCSAACPSPPHHVCSHHSPCRGVGAILTHSLLPAGTFANARPWHLALKPHPPPLACVQEDAVSQCLWTPVGCAGGLPPPSAGAPSAMGALKPPLRMDTAGPRCHRGVSTLRVPSL